MKHKDWDTAAQKFCDAAKVGHPQAKQKMKVQKQVKAEAQEVINKKQVKKQIQQGGFGEFTAEEF